MFAVKSVLLVIMVISLELSILDSDRKLLELSLILNVPADNLHIVYCPLISVKVLVISSSAMLNTSIRILDSRKPVFISQITLGIESTFEIGVKSNNDIGTVYLQ